MNTDSLQMNNFHSQRGNAMVYVLIIVALFGALTFVLARQTDTSEASALSEEQLSIHATNIQQSTMQLKQSIEQMTWSGTAVSALDFTLPDDGTFNDPPITDKLFHPQGGGANLPRLNPAVTNQISTDPVAGWYIGAFNNVEWTPTSADDVILTAHQITQELCENINERLTGSANIPEIQVEDVNELLIDEAESTASSNIEFTSAHCADCFGQPALCVKGNGVNSWTYYTLLTAE